MLRLDPVLRPPPRPVGRLDTFEDDPLEAEVVGCQGHVREVVGGEVTRDLPAGRAHVEGLENLPRRSGTGPAGGSVDVADDQRHAQGRGGGPAVGRPRLGRRSSLRSSVAGARWLRPGGGVEPEDGPWSPQDRPRRPEVAVLRRHRARQREERLAAGPAWVDSGLVFVREDGTALHPDSVSQAFDRHLRQAGLRRITLHSLRHGWATLALEAGVPAKVVSARLVTQVSASPWTRTRTPCRRCSRKRPTASPI